MSDLNIAGIEPPIVAGFGTVEPPVNLTGCTCGDLTIEGKHYFNGEPCRPTNA